MPFGDEAVSKSSMQLIGCQLPSRACSGPHQLMFRPPQDEEGVAIPALIRRLLLARQHPVESGKSRIKQVHPLDLTSLRLPRITLSPKRVVSAGRAMSK